MKVFKIQKDLSHKDVTFRSRLRTFLLVALTVTLVSVTTAFMTTAPKTIVINNSRIDTVYLPEVDIPLTDSAILCELVKLKCILPPIAIAQMRLESSNYTSKIAIENKNIAGMRTSKSKYVIGKNRGHCVYKSYKDCIKDYMRTHNYYLKSIDGKYAESPNYIEALKKQK